MRKLLILATVAAVSAACHNRNEDQAGAAPNEGRTDTTAVTHVVDSTAARQTIDSTAAGQDSSLTSTPQDTLGARSPGAGAIDTAGVRSDTSTAPSSTSVPSDTAASDTTSASDTTKTKTIEQRSLAPAAGPGLHSRARFTSTLFADPHAYASDCCDPDLSGDDRTR
jgi:hypothetical protein